MMNRRESEALDRHITGNYGEDQYDRAVCPACGDVIDYCPGHGETGDRGGWLILQEHDNENHESCHPYSDCKEE